MPSHSTVPRAKSSVLPVEGLQSTPRVQLSLGLDWNSAYFAVPKSSKVPDFKVGCDWCWFWLSQEHGFRLSTRSFSAFFLVFEDEAGSNCCPRFIYLRILPEGLQLKKKHNMKHIKPNLLFVYMLTSIWHCGVVERSDFVSKPQTSQLLTTYLWYLVFESRLGPMHPVPAPASCGASYLDRLRLTNTFVEVHNTSIHMEL